MIHHGSSGRFAVRDGDWKLAFPHKKDPMELYNLATDPREENNVIKDHPEIAKALEKKITQGVRNGRTTPGPAQPNDTGWWKDLVWMDEAADSTF